MKKIISSIILMLGIISCTKQSPAECPRETEPASITLGIESDDSDNSKTFLQNSIVKWYNTDNKIIVWDSQGARNIFTDPNNVSASTKTFSGEITKGSTIAYVMYDGKRGDTEALGQMANGKFYCTTDQNQKITANNSFAAGANVTVMKAGDTALRNVLGYLKFTMPADSTVATNTIIKQIVVSTVGEGEYFGGDIEIDYSGTDPVATLKSDATNKFSSITSAPRIEAGPKYIQGDIYVCVLPGTYHGLKITVTKTDNTSFEIKSDKEFTVERCKYVSFGTLPSDKPIQWTKWDPTCLDTKFTENCNYYLDSSWNEEKYTVSDEYISKNYIHYMTSCQFNKTLMSIPKGLKTYTTLGDCTIPGKKNRYVSFLIYKPGELKLRMRGAKDSDNNPITKACLVLATPKGEEKVIESKYLMNEIIASDGKEYTITINANDLQGISGAATVYVFDNSEDAATEGSKQLDIVWIQWTPAN